MILPWQLLHPISSKSKEKLKEETKRKKTEGKEILAETHFFFGFSRYQRDSLVSC